MKISEHGLYLIKHLEGLRLQAYQCSAGVWTIGYGHTSGVRPGDIIDEAQAGIFLRRDVVASESTVMRFVTVALNQHQFDALVSFVFNLGSGNFAASTLLKKLNAGDYAGAAEEFPRWVHAGGKSLPGLARRREAERTLFLNDPTPAVSTGGWDVISITDLGALNHVINNSSAGRLYPDSFSVDSGDDSEKISVAGTWGAWNVTRNASGAKVNICCDISEGTVTSGGNTHPLCAGSDPAYVEIELSLESISTDPAQWVRRHEIITTDTRGFQLMVDADSPVVVNASAFPGLPEGLLKRLLPAVMEIWFRDNLPEFKQIFAVILVGLQAENTDFQWLYPSAYSYAASNSIDKKTAGFGILTLVDGRTDTGALSQNIDVTALELVKPHGANLALVISKAMLAENFWMRD